MIWVFLIWVFLILIFLSILCFIWCAFACAKNVDKEDEDEEDIFINNIDTDFWNK